MVVWEYDKGRITLDKQYLTLYMESGKKQVYVSEFIEGRLFEFVVREFSFPAAVEICAMITEEMYDHVPKPVTYDDCRKAVPHCFGGGRGAVWTVWFFGKTIRISVYTSDWVQTPDMTFEDYLESGFPLDVQYVIGEDNIEKINSAVRELVSLSCMCDTGVERPHEHGNLRHIVRRQHPFAPIDGSIKVMQCTICGQRWSFGEAGDPRYSYRYSVRRFPSEYALINDSA